MKDSILWVLAWLMAWSANAQMMVSSGFENWGQGTVYTQEHLAKDGLAVPWTNGFGQSRVIIDSSIAHDGRYSIRVEYPKAAVGPEQGGAQAPVHFSGQREVYASYWLYFSDNFDWGGKHEGGKLPGLASGKNCSGGQHCDGSNGFSARLMWRSSGAAVLYLYHMDKPGKYGEDIPLLQDQKQVIFEKGRWYQVAQRVKVNTANNKDGEIEIWINGKRVLERDGLRFVNDGSLVDNFYFSTFHGGADIQWAPSEDCYIWFDDWRVSGFIDDVLEP